MESPDAVTEHPCDMFQEIQCNGSDSKNSFGIYGNNVLVKASELDQSCDASNKIKVSQITKFEWEEKYYLGNLVSSNVSFIAYVLRVKPNADETVRVVNYHTSHRHLLRGFKRKVEDIAFESFKSNRLACIDSEGTVFVFNIYESGEDVKSNIVLQVNRDTDFDKVGMSHRIIWAPCLLVPVDDQQPMLAISFGSKAEVYNLNKIVTNHSSCVLSKSQLTDGVINVDSAHSKDITSLALSPDTKVLATCSLDGEVKFWSLNFEDNTPLSCLHEWEPHNGEPVTCLFFCDNLLLGDDETPLWRYLITGTANNSVLKIWCAVKWECVQTIRFSDYQNADLSKALHPCMKAAIDLSAKYFVLADVFRQSKTPDALFNLSLRPLNFPIIVHDDSKDEKKVIRNGLVLYIMKLHKDDDKEKLSFVSISEFILKEPLLSFSINMGKDKRNQTSDDLEDVLTNGIDADDSIGEKEGKNDHLPTSYLSLFAINKRAMQKYSIKYKASSSVAPTPASVSTSASSQEDGTSIHDALSDITDTSDLITPSINQISAVPSEDEFSNSPRDNTLENENESSLASLTNIDITTSRGLSPNLPAVITENETLINLTETTTSATESITTSIDSRGNTSMVSDSFIDAMDKINFDNISATSTSFNPGFPKLVNGFSSLDMVENEAMNPSTKSFNFSVNEEKPVVVEFERNTTEKNRAEQKLPMAAATYNNINSSLQELILLVKRQQETINSQQKELKEIKDSLKQMASKQVSESSHAASVSQEQLENDRDDLKVYMQLLQKSATSQFTKASKEFQKLCTQRLEQFTNDVNTQAHAKDERTMQALSNLVSNTISIKLEKTVKNEMKQTVLSGLEKMQAKHLENSSNLIAQKLSAWERTLREETQELIKSKPLAESIGYAAASILEGTIPNAYRESFQNVLLPGFEKASRAMVMQINQTFQQGTKQYLERLEMHLDAKQQKHLAQKEPLISNLQDLVQSFQGTADRLTSSVETNLEALMQKYLRDALDRMQGSFTKTIEQKVMPTMSRSISSIIGESFASWQSKVDELLTQVAQNSSNTTQRDDEDSVENKQNRIRTFLEEGEHQKAFELALTARNVSLVTFLCKQIDPTEVFQPAEQVAQSIILSLIQQLSINLTEETDLKTKYLEESIMALNASDPITKEHMPQVLESLNEQLQISINNLNQTEPTNKCIKPLKMLLMASKSLLHGD